MKNIFFIFIVLFFNAEVHACKRDEREVQRLKRTPDSAKEVFIGKIIPGETYPRFDIFWPHKYNYITLEDCGLPMNIETNKTYVYLYQLERPIHKLRSLEFTDGVFFELEKEVPKVLDILASKLVVNKSEPNIFWRYCKKDSECRTIKNSCGKEESFSAKYANNAIEFYSQNQNKKCVNVKPKNKCVNYFCE